MPPAQKALWPGENIKFFEVVSAFDDSDGYEVPDPAEHKDRWLLMRKGDGLMSTIKDKTFDYQAYVKENPPVAAEAQRGDYARRERLEAARMMFTIRIDKDILEQFQQLVPQSEGYERLINEALREWLSAKDMKELVRAELQKMVQHALSSLHVRA